MNNNETIIIAYKNVRLMTEHGEIHVDRDGDLKYNWVDYSGDEPEIISEVLETARHFTLPLTVTMVYRNINEVAIEWYDVKDGMGKTIFNGALV